MDYVFNYFQMKNQKLKKPKVEKPKVEKQKLKTKSKNKS